MVKQGDILKVNLNPQRGNEQAGYRPVVVISNNTYNKMTNLTAVCPITNTKKEFPTHVMLDGYTETTGVVLCEHIKSIDLSAREYKFIEKIPMNLLNEIIDVVIGEIEIED